MNTHGEKLIHDWFNNKGWEPFPFQLKTWDHIQNQKSGLLNARTGSGKTFALLFPSIIKALNDPDHMEKGNKRAIKVLWITPLRALAKDLSQTMNQTCAELLPEWSASFRTGDTSNSEKQKQKRKMPEFLCITPESLHVLIAQKDHESYFKKLDYVVVDEWHELLGSKRGVLTELAISYLKSITDFPVWGVSATINNLDQARKVLLGEDFKHSELVRFNDPPNLEITSVLPDEIERFPWAGHLGIHLIHKTIPIIKQSNSVLIFTNTRSQCEYWYHELLKFAPELAGQMALHHSAIAHDIRTWIEEVIKNQTLKVVVCTSTLDLGVDFAPVDTIIQVGSPKGVARFLQRAGRSGHQPNAVSRAYFVPTHALELIESAALTHAIQNGVMEGRIPFEESYDVLLQFFSTRAVGGGFHPDDLYKTVRKTHCYRNLSRAKFDYLVDFLKTGGSSLKNYDDYHKLEQTENGLEIPSRKLAQRHRLSIGVIVSDPSIRIKFMKGKNIGRTEESFIAQVKPGETFWFAGRCLELVQVNDSTAYVRRSKKTKGKVPRWMGGRMPLSSQLAQTVRSVLTNWKEFTRTKPEMEVIEPLLELQNEWSQIPDEDHLVIELSTSREGHHLFCFPIEGRLAHEAMATLFAWRISRIEPTTFSIAMNDYGFELLSDKPIPLNQALEQGLLSTENLIEDLMASINETEMLQRRFREIAQISGLLFSGFPGRRKKDRHLQSSAGLIYKVFQKYEPYHLLLQQTRDEVLNVQVEQDRILHAFERLNSREVIITHPPKFSPFAFPIMVDRLRERLSSEKLIDRVRRMQKQMEKRARRGKR
jgi:ATP-dependent Lhr-like helicase